MQVDQVYPNQEVWWTTGDTELLLESESADHKFSLLGSWTSYAHYKWKTFSLIDSDNTLMFRQKTTFFHVWIAWNKHERVVREFELRVVMQTRKLSENFPELSKPH